jgi:hypothetical protein
MGPVTVVVRDIAAQDGLEMASSEDDDAINAFAPPRSRKPSANALASGALIGVRMTSVPSDRKTSSKPPGHLASRSRMRKRNGKES